MRVYIYVVRVSKTSFSILYICLSVFVLLISNARDSYASVYTANTYLLVCGNACVAACGAVLYERDDIKELSTRELFIYNTMYTIH